MPAAPRQAGAALAGAAFAALATVLLRGGRSIELGYLLALDGPWRDGLALVAGGALAGLVIPLVAGNHVPGLPLVALAGSWIALSAVVTSPDALPAVDGVDVRRSLAVLELLALAGAAGVATTAAWLVDTRITFPRRYPDPADRPPGKHTSRRDLARRLVPHTAVLAGSVGAALALLAASLGQGPVLWAVAAGVAVALVIALQRTLPARGSIWTAAGLLGGVAVATLATRDVLAHHGGPPALGLAAAVTFAGLTARVVAGGRTPGGRA